MAKTLPHAAAGLSLMFAICTIARSMVSQLDSESPRTGVDDSPEQQDCFVLEALRGLALARAEAT